MEPNHRAKTRKKGRDDRVGLMVLGMYHERAHKAQQELLNQIVTAKDADGYRNVANLDILVGSSRFATWYIVSSSFPLIAAAIGPLANMCAIAALAEPWLYYPAQNYNEPNGGTKYHTIGDPPWVTTLNAVSLAIGVMSNVSLLLNFAGRINYTFSQVFSIGGFFISATMLMVLTLICKYVLMTGELGLTSSFWHAVLTAACYYSASSLLLVNEIGHLRGYYGATFNLNRSQRTLMLQNIALVVWIAAGAAVFQKTMDLSYPDALYLCQVSMLTIGLGDIHPVRSVSRGLMIPFALIGTLLLGLNIASIRTMILTSSSESLSWNYSERNRKKEIKNIDLAETYDERQAFNKMRELHTKAKSYRIWLQLVFSGIVFPAFLTLGALCFSLVEEDWSYFDSIYFCCLCLLTIGYGDPAPRSTIGRAFFIVWSMAAVPMMTILISSMGETIIHKVVELSDKAGDWALEFHGLSFSRVNSWASGFGDGEHHTPGFQKRALSLFAKSRDHEGKEENHAEVDPEAGSDTVAEAETVAEADAESKSVDEGVDRFPTGDYMQDLSNTIVAITKALQKTFDNEVNRPLYKYSYDEWKQMLMLCGRLPYLENPELFQQLKLSPEERAQNPEEEDPNIDEEIQSILEEDQNEQARESFEKARNEEPSALRFKEPPNVHLPLGSSTEHPDLLPHFWLSDLSPLRFPVRENRIFNKKYLNTLEAVSLLMKQTLEEAEGG